jgi:4-amino-4-deoxy-L-arabinose transferase-like glycosyltransferase
MRIVERPANFWLSDNALLLYLALAKFLLHILTNGNYGIFRDELYYVACSKHLDWGYVDHPPLSIFILTVTRTLLGESLFAIRLPAALSGAASVFLAGILARELGGRRFAQVTAAAAYLVMPTSLVLGGFFSMNVFDHLFWILLVLIVIRIMKTDNPRLWMLFGLVAGLGLLNKISVGFLGFGIVLGLLLTTHRKQFLTKWIWIGGTIAGAIFLPHILWQISHGFPTAEFVQNATQYKIARVSPLEYIGKQILETNPLLFPIWLTGLVAFLFGRRLSGYRFLGLVYLVLLTLFIVQNAKAYYLAPTYAILFAGSAVTIEGLLAQSWWRWLKPLLIAYVLAAGLLLVPLAVPMLPPAEVIAHAERLGIQAPREEVGHTSELPQYFSDRFGWEEMVARVADVFHSLTPEEQQKCSIFMGNYGEAGAVDYFGPKYGLPGAISSHNSYWLWGPGEAQTNLIITVGTSRHEEELREWFSEVAAAGTHYSEWALERELTIYICRNPKVTIDVIWPQIKEFI